MMADVALSAALQRADRLITWMSRYIGNMAPGDYGSCYSDLNEHGIFMDGLKADPVIQQAQTIVWNLSLAYRMVRQRNHALIDRQRCLQQEQSDLSKQLDELRARIEKVGNAIAIVEKAGGDATSLRTQIGRAHTEAQRIAPRHAYLEEVTSLLAANLRLIGQAYDALHWLNFENAKLTDFDDRS